MAPKDTADSYDREDVSSHHHQQQAVELPRAAKRSSVAPRTAAACTLAATATTPASPEPRRKRQRSGSVTSQEEATPKKQKKRLRWSTITIHEFGVGLGGSSVSGKGGPAIGLGDAPEFTWTAKVGEMAERCEGVHRFTPDERVRLLRSAGVSDGMILRFSREANIINCSRRRTLVEDVAERRAAREARRAEAAVLERPISPFLNRPHMIPANYA